MEITWDSLEVLRDQWQDDCRMMIPEFELLDGDRMEAEIVRARGMLDMHGASNLAVISAVLRDMDEDKGPIPPQWWWIAACLEILPDLESHPWFELVWWTYYDMRGKRETTTLWGSASCGKTEVFAALVLTNLVIWYDDFHVYVSSPYKNAGADKIWKAVNKRVESWVEDRPDWAVELELTFKSVKDEISARHITGASSTAAFVSLETTAPVQGKKRERREGVTKFDKRRGAVMIIGDELIINNMACRRFLEGEENIVSNTNFMGFVGMNPIPDQVTHANAIKFSEPSEVSRESLTEHGSFTWRTTLGRLLRFCMANSPNRFNDEPVFDFLINHEQADAATKRGEHAYAAQVAAWGWAGGMGNGGVLSLDRVNAEDRQAGPAWTMVPEKIGFFDLAFGGRDPAGYCCLEMGTALVNGVDTHVFNGSDHQKLSVMREWIPTKAEIEKFIYLARERGGRAPTDMHAGRPCDANHHMTFQVLSKARELGIPKGRVSFDSSLRPDITIMMRDALGHVPWFYSGTRPLKDEQVGWPLWPPIMKPDSTRTVWLDLHSQPISCAWRFAEHLVSQGHVHGLSKLRKGLMELISRKWVPGVGGKYDVEGKKKLAISPMWGETFALAVVFGHRFCGALPQLLKDRPQVTGTTENYFEHPAFAIKTTRLNPRMWK